MTRNFWISSFFGLFFFHPSYSQQTFPTRENPLAGGLDSLSYALGINYSGWLKTQGLDSLDYLVFLQAIQANLENRSLLMDNKSAYMTIQNKLQELTNTRLAENLAAGQQFLDQNRNKPGVVTLPDGLQYQVLVAGTGSRPIATDSVRVDYVGKLMDGTVFDSSITRGKPLVIGVSQVIKGWTEALKLMPVGSRWRLFIPASLGYGIRQAGSIPPNSVLIFDVDLLGIEP